MFRQQYRSLNEQIAPDAELMARMLRAARAPSRKRTTRFGGKRKGLLATLALVCLLCTAPVLAATVPAAYEALYAVSPATAQFFKPVRMSCVSNDIRMEVLSAYVHGDTAEIYLSLHDLKGNHIDATTDLFDSYSIHRPFDSAATCRLVSYDKEAQRATFLISITEFGGQAITGEKITFSVRQLLSGKTEYDGVQIPLSPASVCPAARTQTVSSSGGGGAGYPADSEAGRLTALVPGTPLAGFPVEGVDLTGAALVDGKLHLQAALHDRLTTDNHGYFYLKDSAGNKRTCDYNFYFTEGTGETRMDYCEYVFHLPQESLAQYTLYGDFVTGGVLTEGDWQVTFPLSAE